MYDDDKIFPRLLQALIDDANIDIVTVNWKPTIRGPKNSKAATGFHKPLQMLPLVRISQLRFSVPSLAVP